jgi:hypothetical protein
MAAKDTKSTKIKNFREKATPLWLDIMAETGKIQL